MAAPSAGRGFLDDPSKQSSPVARPPRIPATEPTSPPTAASEQPASASRPVGDAADAAAEDACAETVQRLFKLNVDAVEFSPQATFQTAGAAWNVGAAEFLPQAVRVQVGGGGEPQPDSYSFPTGDAAAAEDAYEESEAFGGDTEENNDMEVMLRAHETLAELARAPARFEHLTSLLIADVSPLVGASEQALQNLADVIVDYAESSPNVSYTCAQLCAHLNESGIGGRLDAFRRCLLLKCSKSSKKLLSAHGSTKRRWFTTFLAELFVAIVIPLDSDCGGVNHDASVQSMKSAALSKGVKKMLMALLGFGAEEEQSPSDDDLKCVAQVLKLCGWELASYERDNPSSSSSATSLASTSTTSVTSSVSALSSSGTPSSSVSDVLKALRSRRDRAGVSCQRLIDSVVALEASGWGRSQSATDIATPAPAAMQAAVAPNELQYQQLPFQCEPVFYSHDGREISRREAGFADFEDEFQSDVYEFGGSTVQDDASGGGDNYVGPASYYDDPELNDEICEAFEVFCEQNATASRDQQYQSKSS